MILTCPACNTRYRVDDAALAEPEGRELRCANCKHLWRYLPAPAERPAEPLAPAEPPPEPMAPIAVRSPEPATAPLSRPAPPPLPVPQRGSRVGLAALILVAIIAVAGAVGVLARDRIVALWPPAAGFYRTVGLRLEPVGAGLEISKVSPSRTADSLVVEGEVANTTGSDHIVPRLRILLRDAGGKELTSKIIDPPAPNLAPGATAHFKTQFEHPSDAATGVAVTFTAG